MRKCISFYRSGKNLDFTIFERTLRRAKFLRSQEPTSIVIWIGLGMAKSRLMVKSDSSIVRDCVEILSNAVCLIHFFLVRSFA